MRTVVTAILANAISIAIAVGVTTAVSSPAFAQDGTAPACIERPTAPNYVIVNRCGKHMNVKVARGFPHQDDPCVGLERGEAHWVEPKGYDKTVVC